MKHWIRLGMLLFLVHGLASVAQSAVPQATAAPSKVFVLAFGDDTDALPPDAKNLNEFAPSVMQWRLRGESQITVSRQTSLTCDRAGASSSVQALAPSDQVYYTVRGSVTPRVTEMFANSAAGSSPVEMVLSYELDKVSNCAPEVLLRRSVPITAANALDVTSVMANLITLKLETVLSPPQVVATKPVDASGSDAALNAQVHALLCRTADTEGSADPTCMQNAEAAIPLLLQLVKRHPRDAGELDWLGLAQMNAGHFLDASKSFNAALKLLANAPPQQQWPVLERSADTEYHLDSYNLAVMQYQAALHALAGLPGPDTAASAAQIQLKLARSMRFNGDRLGAFEALLKGPQKGHEAEPYVEELRDLVSSMQKAELAKADERLSAADGAAVDANVKTQVYNREAQAELDTLGTTSQLAKMDTELKKADALAGAVDTPTRVTTLWLRSQWYVDKGQWELARKNIEETVKLNNENDPWVQYRAAVFYYTWASMPGTTDSQKPELWKRAAALSEPLLEENKSTTPAEILRFSESIYRNANHRVDQDKITQAEYEKIVKRYPGDFAVRRGLIGLYTDFMKKPTLALESARATYALPETKRDTATLLDIAEVYAINGEYGEADIVFRRLEPTLDEASSVRDLGLNAVTYFYQTWVAFAKQDAARATRTKSAWLAAMGRYRGSGGGGSFVWMFEGAGNVLNKLPGMQEADKATLEQMINVMTNVTVPLPKTL